MIVIADTSSIYYFLLIGQIDLLPGFYGQVIEFLLDGCLETSIAGQSE
jgi:predicted nucleic acid-binding protein